MTEKRRPRILFVTRNLPPLVGGMERLNWHMAEELSRFAEVRVIGPVGAAALAPENVAVSEVPLSPLRSFLWHALLAARSEAARWRPDIVLAGSGLTAPHALWAARACRADAVAYIHGLDIAVRHPVYRALWLPAIRRLDRVIANSRPTAELCRQTGLSAERIGIVHPGVDRPCEEDPQDATAFRRRWELGDRPLLLSVGRLSARKGLREFVTQALPRIVSATPEVLLLVVGSTPEQALHASSQSIESICEAARVAGVADHLRFLGKLDDHELQVAYQAATVHMFPVRDIPGDPEGFGMVAIEAASHGLPTVAFASGGVVDAVNDGVSGHLIAPGDYDGLANAAIALLGAKEALRSACTAHAAGFYWPTFGERVIGQLRPMLVARLGGDTA